MPVSEADSVPLRVLSCVELSVALGVALRVDVALGLCVPLELGVIGALLLWDAELLPVSLGVPVFEALAVRVPLRVTTCDVLCVGVAVTERVSDEVRLELCVSVGLCVTLCERLGEADGVAELLELWVGVRTALGVALCVADGPHTVFWADTSTEGYGGVSWAHVTPSPLAHTPAATAPNPVTGATELFEESCQLAAKPPPVRTRACHCCTVASTIHSRGSAAEAYAGLLETGLKETTCEK